MLTYLFQNKIGRLRSNNLQMCGKLEKAEHRKDKKASSWCAVREVYAAYWYFCMTNLKSLFLCFLFTLN